MGGGIWMRMAGVVRMRIMVVRDRMRIVEVIRMFMLGIRIENWLVRRRTRNRLIQSDVRDENQPFTDFDDQEMRKKVL